MLFISTSDTWDSNNNKYFCPIAKDLYNENDISMMMRPKKEDDLFEDFLGDEEEDDLEDSDEKEEVDFEEDFIDKEDDKAFYEEAELDDFDSIEEDEDDDDDEEDLY